MLDPLHLRTFVAITEVKSFSEAGRQLGLLQSSVSEHVKRLEQFAGQRLFQRDTHSNALTEHGRAMLEFARSILEVNERARRHFTQSTKRQLFRFGACEDLAMAGCATSSAASWPAIPRWIWTSPSPSAAR
ncbi:LysR family transcriptional regulator [Nitrospirillum viridazoti]|uniref:LysR family transcriptional regulator n=1 Tax=Nitrospirillum viridazoti TaxID=3144925 RepID=UPI0011AD3EC4|nr:LysR family transcriptional regulator [Nitrospirillum amazonense]TWB37869.1 regulatory helix-turn-helix LysR family protein [Nitrospirillum amazonense]